VQDRRRRDEGRPRRAREEGRAGLSERPPIQRWWVTYVLVSAAAVVAVIAALEAVTRFVAPLAHLGLVVLLAIVVAFILAPVAMRIEARIHRRAPAVVLTFLLALVLLLGLLGIVAAPLVTESTRLADQIPDYVARLQSDAPVVILGYQVPDALRVQIGAAAGSVGGAVAGQAVTIVVGLVSGVVDLFLVLVIALYLLLDARRIRTSGYRLVPANERERVERVESEVVRVFGAYLRGQLLLAVIVGTAATIALLLLGVPYALVLGVFAGMAELIPMLGPIFGAVPAVLVAMFQPFPLVLWVVLAFIVIQQVESNLLVPRISGHAVGLHPLAAMLALLVGFEVAGVLGALFAVPLAGIAWVFGSAVIRARAAHARERGSSLPA
jgi:predicted PurR-regulated permease PerM